MTRLEVLLALAERLRQRLADVQAQIERERRDIAIRGNLRLLTAREAQTFVFVLEGKMNKEIALEMGITLRTVKWHVASILTKTNYGRLELR